MKWIWKTLNRYWYRGWGKRCLDIVVSGLTILLFGPFIVPLALMIQILTRAPVLFVQTRPGLHGRSFRIFKFRSMTNERDPNGEYLPDHLRLTWFGGLLRSTSLDELPQFWNVLRGEMSLIGPRPLLVEYLPLYTPEQHRRHTVRPGMTGLAQTNGRNQVTWEERLAWDIRYVDDYSFSLDCRILARTIMVVFRSEECVTAADGSRGLNAGCPSIDAARDRAAIEAGHD